MVFVKNVAAVSLLGLVCFCDWYATTRQKWRRKARKRSKKLRKKLKKSSKKVKIRLKEAPEAAKQWTEETIAKAKEECAKLSGTHLEEFEKKIKELSGEAQPKLRRCTTS